MKIEADSVMQWVGAYFHMIYTDYIPLNTHIQCGQYEANSVNMEMPINLCRFAL